MDTTVKCACGCGQLVTPDGRGRPRRFVRGHQSRMQTSLAVPMVCEHCGSPISVLRYLLKKVDHHFCNAACHHAWAKKLGLRRGSNNGHYNTITVPCAGCDSPVSKAASLINRRNGNVYCPACQLVKGSHVISWADYPPEFSKALRHRIRVRDGHKCVLCGTPGKGHQVHHIDYDRSNNAAENLCTLCRKCHGFTVFAHQKWTAHLRALMAERLQA